MVMLMMLMMLRGGTEDQDGDADDVCDVMATMRMLTMLIIKPYGSQRSDKLSSIVARIGGNLVECVVYTVQPHAEKTASWRPRFWGPKSDPTPRPKALPLLFRCVLTS